MRVAAIDIGTVTTRILVAEVTGSPERPVVSELHRGLRLTHLGAGLSASGVLAPDAIDRVASAVRSFVPVAEEMGVERLEAVATSACRDAANTGELLSRLSEAGVFPEVISGDREAQLSFLGAAYSLHGEGLLVADLGGGSTELILGRSSADAPPEVTVARSVDVGSKRMTERFLSEHPPHPDRLEEAYGWACAEMQPFFEGLPEPPRMLVSLAGTATSLAALKLGLVEYDPDVVHGSELTLTDLGRLLSRLAPLDLDGLRRVPGLDPGRADVIVAGAVVLTAVIALSGLPSTEVSEHDILYGIALDAYLRERR